MVPVSAFEESNNVVRLVSKYKEEGKAPLRFIEDSDNPVSCPSVQITLLQ
jgi:hypothetical protein